MTPQTRLIRLHAIDVLGFDPVIMVKQAIAHGIANGVPGPRALAKEQIKSLEKKSQKRAEYIAQGLMWNGQPRQHPHQKRPELKAQGLDSTSKEYHCAYMQIYRKEHAKGSSTIPATIAQADPEPKPTPP